MELSRVDGVEKMHGEDNPQEKPKKVKKPKARTPKNEDSEPSKKEVRNGMKSGFSFLTCRRNRRWRNIHPGLLDEKTKRKCVSILMQTLLLSISAFLLYKVVDSFYFPLFCIGLFL